MTKPAQAAKSPSNADKNRYRGLYACKRAQRHKHVTITKKHTFLTTLFRKILSLNYNEDIYAFANTTIEQCMLKNR